MQQVREAVEAVIGQVERAVHGKRAVLELAMTCVLADGHLLLEDVPGTAKTLLSKALSKAIGGQFRRIQCTPDLLPGDITGSFVFNQAKAEFEFHAGPIFANVLLADEINRATPRTQTALLEAMAERQVTVEGRTYACPRPFIVVATQNPVEHEGTFPLPEAQLDRFLFRLSVGYPSLEAEDEMLVRSDRDDPLDLVQQVLTPEHLVAAQRAVRQVHVQPEVRQYVIRIVASTRSSPELVLGASPRATKGLYRAAQALALMSGRDFVIPDDVKRLVPATLNHRVILGAEGRLSQRSVSQAVNDAVKLVPAPVLTQRPAPPASG